MVERKTGIIEHLNRHSREITTGLATAALLGVSSSSPEGLSEEASETSVSAEQQTEETQEEHETGHTGEELRDGELVEFNGYQFEIPPDWQVLETGTNNNRLSLINFGEGHVEPEGRGVARNNITVLEDGDATVYDEVASVFPDVEPKQEIREIPAGVAQASTYESEDSELSGIVIYNIAENQEQFGSGEIADIGFWAKNNPELDELEVVDETILPSVESK